MRYISLFVVFLFIGSKSIAQNATVDSKYHSPLGIPLQLSAIFGDIRPNHFHMGLDFKTNQREGIPIHSISDGYISRIRISPIGYGRVLYIDHPNGITSVYAHCLAFSDKITDFLEPFQVEAFSNNIDLKLLKNELTIQKGEFIALSGNSGSSTGPHLHFEIRDTKTEHG
ncbi:MAG: M23 family metallopeptidase, partial [Bacteroidota bacterium]